MPGTVPGTYLGVRTTVWWNMASLRWSDKSQFLEMGAWESQQYILPINQTVHFLFLVPSKTSVILQVWLGTGAKHNSWRKSVCLCALWISHIITGNEILRRIQFLVGEKPSYQISGQNVPLLSPQLTGLCQIFTVFISYRASLYKPFSPNHTHARQSTHCGIQTMRRNIFQGQVLSYFPAANWVLWELVNSPGPLGNQLRVLRRWT